MSIRDILLYPEHSDVLTTECDPVEEVDEEVRTLVDDLMETMYDAEGIGLAAPQVGVTRRVTVIDVSASADSAEEPHVLINPEIVEQSGQMTREEGCLSFPGLYGEVMRSEYVKVEATDRDGDRYEIEAEGSLLSTALQHEIDHLDGVLFLDRMTRLKRRMARKEYKKIRSKMDREDSQSAV